MLNETCAAKNCRGNFIIVISLRKARPPILTALLRKSKIELRAVNLKKGRIFDHFAKCLKMALRQYAPVSPIRKIRPGNSLTLRRLHGFGKASEAGPLESVPHRVRRCSPFLGQQLRQYLFGAQVMRLALVELFFRFHARGNGQKAIQAARVETAIFVLCAAIHDDLRKYPQILGPIRIRWS